MFSTKRFQRSFTCLIGASDGGRTELGAAIAYRGGSACARSDRVAARNIFVFVHTNTFNNDPFYSNGASARFAETTNETGEVVGPAVRLGERLWRGGFRYSKTGVMITGLMPGAIWQPALWGELDREKRERASKRLDKFTRDSRAQYRPHPWCRAQRCCLEAQGGGFVPAMDDTMG